MRWLVAAFFFFTAPALAQAPDKLVADTLLAEQRGLALFRTQEHQEPAGSASAGATRPQRLLVGNTQIDAPTERHVFLSLKHDVPVFVLTRTGAWKVESGLITRIN